MGDSEEVLDLFYVQGDQEYTISDIDKVTIMAGYGYGNGFTIVVQRDTPGSGSPPNEPDEFENSEGTSTYENAEGTDTVEDGS